MAPAHPTGRGSAGRVTPAVIRLTNDSFHLPHRLLPRVEHILAINELHTVTKKVVEVAREGLEIGPM